MVQVAPLELEQQPLRVHQAVKVVILLLEILLQVVVAVVLDLALPQVLVF